MKAYKIDLSMYEGKVREVVYKECYKHGESLGYTKNNPDLDFSREAEAITFEASGEIKHHSDIASYPSDGNTAITAADFLALTTAKDEQTFKPFDKVLVRDGRGETWRAELFSHTIENDYSFVCTSGKWMHCIPYEGNEHLLGTTEGV